MRGAFQLLSFLDNVVREANLERWEPELCQAVAQLLLRCINRGGADEVIDEMAIKSLTTESTAKLFRLDIAVALEISKENGA
jgi:hypothetical protein